MNSKHKRDAGILLHITSLPSPYGIGDLGRNAYAVADWMEKADIRLWQLLPLNPTGFGNSPYAPRSTFAGNELLIDLESLMHEGYLSSEDLLSMPSFPDDRVHFQLVQERKLPVLKKAAIAFLEKKKHQEKAFLGFCKDQSFWLDDYALFMVLYETYQDARWFSQWPEDFAKREKNVLRAFCEEHEREIAIWKVLQYFFALQWDAFKRYVNAKQIQLVGDVPIFVAADSADTWSNLHLFKTDDEGQFSAVSGVPPDIFSATGQLWGNPVYDWNVLEAEGYQWWIKRLERLFAMIDILRVDHFRGFDAYYEIPAGDRTAERGKWITVDGKSFFKKVRDHFGSVPIIAEDLGLMTDSVEALRDDNGFPGMKILQFGFSKDEQGRSNYYDDFLPHNWQENFVAYTGTHDNNTTLGWFNSLDVQDKEMVLTYLDCQETEVVRKMIRTLMLSCARTAIIPMQDLLEKDEQARMNYPSTCNDVNWSWRATADEFTDEIAHTLANLVVISARNGLLGT
nr:4-alpha-glucanotransferase [uncultured Sphaerochaeta sp.]